jgi:CheY-like chemotaxis protein
MFDPYFTTKGTGHGFGLSMVLGIAKSHHAAVDVWSKAGVGTRVTLLFPVAVTDGARRLAEPKVDRAPLPRLLVVDDDPLLRNSVDQFLSARGWQVVTVESGEAALKCVADTPDFAAILVDFNMPDMNGNETIRKLRQVGCTSPAILCSGDSSANALVDPQFDAFAPKPFQYQALTELLRSVTCKQND